MTGADRQRIVALATRGEGLTEDGRYVPMTAPGDFVRFGNSPVIEPGPCHVPPPCSHFPACGGCQLQHVSDSAYAEWLVSRIVRALAGQGVEAREIEPPHLSPPRTRRRASLRAQRRSGTLRIGFNAEASHAVVDMHECHVLRPELFRLVQALRPLLDRLLQDEEAAGISLTLTGTGADLLLTNVAAGTVERAALLAAFAEAHDLARLSVESGTGLQVLVERRAPTVTLGGVAVAVPPAAFLQATEDGEAALQEAVLRAVEDLPRARRGGKLQAADLFAGIGTFALPLSARARVQAVDAAGPALAALDTAARASGRAVETVHRDLFRRPLQPDELERFDLLLFDPPRAGARAQALELARSRVPRIVAVSCNPSSFARDAAILVQGGFTLRRLKPVGQFTWSNHAELVATFQR